MLQFNKAMNITREKCRGIAIFGQMESAFLSDMTGLFGRPVKDGLHANEFRGFNFVLDSYAI